MKALQSLVAWQEARAVAAAAYRLTKTSPLRLEFDLADQVRRSAISIPANIAEGYALGTRPQFVKHLRYALASTLETWTHLELAKDLQLLPPEGGLETIDRAHKLIGILIGLLRSLGATVPRSPAR